MDSTSLILSITIAVTGFAGAVWATFAAYRASKKDTEEIIQKHKTSFSAPA